jgi:hypothetical protein
MMQIAETFVTNLQSAVQCVKDDPSLCKKGSAAMYGNAASIPSNSVVEEFLISFLDKVYRVQPI